MKHLLRKRYLHAVLFQHVLMLCVLYSQHLGSHSDNTLRSRSASTHRVVQRLAVLPVPVVTAALALTARGGHRQPPRIDLWVPAHMQVWCAPRQVSGSCNSRRDYGGDTDFADTRRVKRRAGRGGVGRSRCSIAAVAHIILPVVLAALLLVLPLVSAAIDPAQRQALVDFYLATNGTTWTVQDGWDSYAVASSDPCSPTWHGLTCDASDPQNVL